MDADGVTQEIFHHRRSVAINMDYLRFEIIFTLKVRSCDYLDVNYYCHLNSHFPVCQTGNLNDMYTRRASNSAIMLTSDYLYCLMYKQEGSYKWYQQFSTTISRNVDYILVSVTFVILSCSGPHPKCHVKDKQPVQPIRLRCRLNDVYN